MGQTSRDEERKYYNALNISLLSNYETLGKFFASGKESWKQGWLKFKKANLGDAPVFNADPDEEWSKLEKKKIKVILRGEPDFPRLLSQIPWCPHGIYLLGDLLLESEPTIAIVGTRKATAYGLLIAKKFSRILAEGGLTIISGLALGVDAAAHEGALEARGRTVAVLANGLDRVYPRHHENLAKKILEQGGALISEYPIGAPSLPHRFIERNRIVSGLSLGIVVVEAPTDSGSLATARFALDQNREVMVVPGPLDNRNYAGSHELIKSGAALITGAEDITANLNLNLDTGSAKKAALESKILAGELDGSQKKVINVLQASGEALAPDQIANRSHLVSALVGQALGFLVVGGFVKEEKGKYSLI
ncbi:MAG TPA: DNA-processing protein DprA [Candidatus Paceibacterota bacterium]